MCGIYNKEKGINYPSFICKCFCGKLFLRDCKNFMESNNVSCGHCNDILKQLLSNYNSLKNIPQEVLKSVLKIPIYIINESKYNDVEIGTIIENIRILKYLPSFNNFGPCYICECLYCKNLFLAPAHHVLKGSYKTCGSFECNRLRINDNQSSYKYNINNKKEYIDLTEDEKKDLLLKLNKNYTGIIKGNDLFVKAIKVTRSKSGYISYRIVVLCQNCKQKEREVDFRDWFYQNEHFKKCDCTRINKRKNLKSNINTNLYKTVKSEKFKYLAKGSILKGEDTIWLLDMEKNCAIRVYGKDFLKNPNSVHSCVVEKNSFKKDKNNLKYHYQEYLDNGRIGDLKLISIFPTEDLPKHKGYFLFIVKCPFCNELFGRDFYSLKDRHCKSCGCIQKYRGEEQIFSILDSFHNKCNDLTFSREKEFDGLKGIGNNPLRFDFCIYYKNKIFCLIEFNGLEHYSPFKQINITDKKKAEKIFNRIQEHDRRKREFCKKENIPLCEIRYTLSKEEIKEKIITFLRGI